MYTGNEMGDELLLRLDRMDLKTSRGWEDDELSAFLNRAQIAHIQSILTKLNPKLEAFDETELRKQGLSELIRFNQNSSPVPQNSDVLGSEADVFDNSYTFEMPEDFWFPITERCQIDQILCSQLPAEKAAVLPVVPVTNDEYNLQIKNPYRRPFFKNDEGLVWRIQFNRADDGYDDESVRTVKRAVLITDGTFAPVVYRFRYLRVPPKVVVDFDNSANQKNCVLDFDVQEAIIDLAVKIIKEVSDRQQVQILQPFEKLN